jgi:Zinc carboxypeptidase
VQHLSARRLTLGLWLVALLAAVPLLTAGTAGAEIAPPWCGTPEPDAAGNLPDGSLPPPPQPPGVATHPAGSFPHIPYYAIGCTLEDIENRSADRRMTLERFGKSALGRDKFLVVINALETRAQRRAYLNWLIVRHYALEDPEKAQKLLDRFGDDVKVPIFVQGGIHGNEYEGVDAAMQVIEDLATTPYGEDPRVDQVLDQAIVIFNPIQNPDGRIAGTRANGNGFDLNRDFLTQSQPETVSSVAIMQRWLAPEMLDLHGYVTPTLIEATTKPHNPGIEYDLWLKWNQARIDANEAAMNARGYDVTRPINDWCWDGDIPVGGLCPLDPGEDPSRVTHWGPKWAESWDDWGPFYTPMYSQLVGLNGSTVEMCNEVPLDDSDPPRPIPIGTPTDCGPGTTTYEKVGRSGAREHQYITVWSSLLFDTDNREELMHDQLEIYIRGDDDAARPPLSSFPDHPTDQSRQFRNIENYWMHDYPQAYVLPIGEGQRSDVEARRLARWLLENGIHVERVEKKYDFRDGTTQMRFEKGSYVVFMDQPFRGLADTALGPGVNVSDRIDVLYAPPGAWSHGELWGANVVTIPDGARFRPKTERTRRIRTPDGEVEGRRNALRFALELDSPTAVKTVNALLAAGVTAELATTPFTNVFGEQLPAGTVLFPTSARRALEDAAEDSGLDFTGVRTLPTREPIDRTPRIAVLTGALTQEIWVLRQLGFTADPVSTATINSAPTDPLANYDVVFNQGNWPGATLPTARTRLTAFFASGGGYIGAGFGGANFLATGGQVAGLTPATVTSTATRSVRGWSGIINWDNHHPGTGQITGAYPSRDRAIVDPPVWFTGVPSAWTVDGSLPLMGFFLSGLWKFAGDAQSASAPGSPVIAHGANTAGTSRMTTFAMNPLYRADPEREWPMLASAAYWADQ